MATVTSTSFLPGATVEVFEKSPIPGRSHEGAALASGVVSASGVVTITDAALRADRAYALTDGARVVTAGAWTPDPVGGRVVAAGNLGAAYQLDARGDRDVLLTGTLNANNALTFANLAAGSVVTVVVTQDATGNRTLTVNGAAVAVNGTPASVTVLRAYSPDGSAVYVDAPGVDPAVVGAQVTRTTARSIANNAYETVPWTVESWDTHGFVNLGASDIRVTVPTGLGGLYGVAWVTAWANNSTGHRASWIRVNNATYPGNDFKLAREVSAASSYIELPLAAGDYVEMVVLQTSGGALNLEGAGIVPWPRMSVRRLGPTP